MICQLVPLVCPVSTVAKPETQRKRNKNAIIKHLSFSVIIELSRISLDYNTEPSVVTVFIIPQCTGLRVQEGYGGDQHGKIPCFSFHSLSLVPKHQS